MKWVNLADRQPKTESVRFRYAPTGRIIPIGYICRDGKTFIEEIRDTCNGTDDYEYSLKEIEWLDESESIHDWGPRLYTKEELDTLLAEQHRNTRHDVIDLLTEIAGNGDINDKIVKAIMNMKQRKPNGT